MSDTKKTSAGTPKGGAEPKTAAAKAAKPTAVKPSTSKSAAKSSTGKASGGKASGARPAVAGKAAASGSAATEPNAAAKPDAVKPAAAKPATAKPDAAAKPAVATPALAPLPDAETQEENPLHRKLRIRPGDAGVVIAPPQDDDNPLLPLPQSFLVLEEAGQLASQEGTFAYIHVFARDRGELLGAFGTLREKLAPGGSLWISWLKQGARAGGLAGDLNENVIRRIGLTNAMVDVKVAALDRDWSALLLVHRKR